MVILGLGTNLENRIGYLAAALEHLTCGIDPIIKNPRVSPIYESDALLLPGSPPEWNIPFYNLALSGDTKLSPLELLSIVKGIEQKIGRKDSPRWSPREIDIDILAWEDLALNINNLNIPHKNLYERPFALWPLADLSPAWTFPKGTTAAGKKAFEISHDMGSRFNYFPWAKAPCNTRRASSAVQAQLAAHCEQLKIELTDGTLGACQIIGILNLTPDSFSDGGLHFSADEAVNRALLLIKDGAKVIDLGAESTRPGASEVSAEQEWQRLNPVLELLVQELKQLKSTVKISIDTRHVEVAEKALQLGAHWINDVTGARNQQMRSLVRESRCQYVSMHSLSIPVVKTETIDPTLDPLEVINTWAKEMIDLCLKDGISPEQIIIDPGIGFGKTAEQSLELLRRSSEIKELGVKVLLGPSRKSFMSRFTEQPSNDRDLETAVCCLAAPEQGIDYLRVHNVASLVRALRTNAYAKN